MPGLTLPQRKPIPHAVPSWVGPGARYFITIVADDRRQNPFAQDQIAMALLDGLRFYDKQGNWYLWAAVIMPDHLHFIATFDTSRSLDDTIGNWKKFQARTLKVAFQKNFIDHRLRDDGEYQDKMAYIRLNPVTKSLVAQPEAWKYYWRR